MTILVSATACTSDAIPSTPIERDHIAAQVSRCFPNLMNGHWTRIEGLEQWEFGFELTTADYHNQKSADCLNRISEDLAKRDLDVMISYHAPEGAKN